MTTRPAGPAPEPVAVTVPAEPLTPAAFAETIGVSRETLARLEVYAALLAQLQKAINLVGRETLRDPWRRHFLDSVQLLPLLPDGVGDRPVRVLDLGSGAGFPGLVLAILAAGGQGPRVGLEMHLVEATQRKCVFLREVARRTDTPVTVHDCRLEALAPFAVDAITARGFAPLPRLLGLAAPFLEPGGESNGARPVGLFPKGRNAQDELTAARKEWKMTVRTYPSVTDPSGVILRLEDMVRGQTG